MSAFCSRNAHDRNVLVRRPQSGQTQVPVQRRLKEQAWKDGEGGLLIFCARATRGLRRPSLDARSGRSSRPHSHEPKASKLGPI